MPTTQISLPALLSLVLTYDRRAREAAHAGEWDAQRRYLDLASRCDYVYSERLGELLDADAR